MAASGRRPTLTTAVASHLINAVSISELTLLLLLHLKAVFVRAVLVKIFDQNALHFAEFVEALFAAAFKLFVLVLHLGHQVLVLLVAFVVEMGELFGKHVRLMSLAMHVRLQQHAHLTLKVLVQLVLLELLCRVELQILLLVDRVHIGFVVLVQEAELAVLLVLDLFEFLAHLVLGRLVEHLFSVCFVLFVLSVVLVFVQFANVGLLLL